MTFGTPTDGRSKLNEYRVTYAKQSEILAELM